jgi:MFS superfamily sulfate permease-like transporter
MISKAKSLEYSEEAENIEIANGESYRNNKVIPMFRIPADGLVGLSENWKSDLLSGFVVSLIALPLCLGISLASGFPAISGVYTAIIGGLIITFFSGSAQGIKGPAGGLSAIALGAVEALGSGDMMAGYRFALAAIVVAGLIQIVFGLVKAGTFGDFFPASTVHGMLASLGIMMAAKQIHILLGVKPESKNYFALLMEIPHSIAKMNPEIALIGFVSLMIMIVMSLIKNRFVQMLPAPLIVILLAVPMVLIFGINKQDGFLVNMPSNVFGGFAFPDFSKIFTFTSIEYILMFALVGSIESLLSAKASDTLDPYKRKSDLSKDLFAIGIGNTFAGLLGGLPMITEIKRSAININNGSKTRWSNFFHGVFLLILIIVAVNFIELIPNSALAAMLIFAAYRLAAPREFYKTYNVGLEQFLIFIITIVSIMATNILAGIAIGVVTELIMHLFFGVKPNSLFKANIDLKETEDGNFTLIVKDTAIFSNYIGIRKHLDGLPKHSNVTFDFSQATVVDHSFMEHVNSFEEKLNANGGQIEITGLDYHKNVSEHPLASKRIIKQRKEFSPRQDDLKDFAAENELEFDHRVTLNISRYQGFLLSKGYKILEEENVIKGNHRSYAFDISDLRMEKGQSVTKQEFKMTNVLIYDMKFPIPDFYIEQDGFADAPVSSAGFKDINFDEYPNFSYYYLLKGPDEAAIRKFFNKYVIMFFEANKGYKIECIKGNIFIYKKPGRIRRSEDLDNLLEFTRVFIDLIISEYQGD